MKTNYPIISADSHITEAPGTYVDYIDPSMRDRAPRIVNGGEKVGDMFEVEGMRPISLGLVAAAGKPASEIRVLGERFEDLHRSGWDANYRVADQQRDGVSAEVIYPTVGMVLCNHKDVPFKVACFEAYNRWIAEYCAVEPQRLIGCGQSAMTSPADGIRDLETIKALGLRGVMMPGEPAYEHDYDHRDWDAFYEAAVELQLPLSFHILTYRAEKTRGPKMSQFLSTVRGCQDIMAMFVLGGVFERNPNLKVVCAEADAGWVPHFMYRMDHAFNRHRYWLPAGQELSRMPSEIFAEHIYTTFQDDWTAFAHADSMNWRRLMWANDFPHSDSTWPWSQALLDEHTAQLSEEQQRAILCDNVAQLYNMDVDALLPS